MSIYNTISKRVIMRILEIFILTGMAGAVSYSLDGGLVPFYLVPIAEGILKALREWKDEKRFEEDHSELPSIEPEPQI